MKKKNLVWAREEKKSILSDLTGPSWEGINTSTKGAKNKTRGSSMGLRRQQNWSPDGVSVFWGEEDAYFCLYWRDLGGKEKVKKQIAQTGTEEENSLVVLKLRQRRYRTSRFHVKKKRRGHVTDKMGNE